MTRAPLLLSPTSRITQRHCTSNNVASTDRRQSSRAASEKLAPKPYTDTDDLCRIRRKQTIAVNCSTWFKGLMSASAGGGAPRLVLLGLLVVSLLLPPPAAALRRINLRSGTDDGPPKRPEKFNSMAELNQYLSDLADYYTVIGRPRFGKRAGPTEHNLELLQRMRQLMDHAAAPEHR